jgi:hypothetical protein
VEHLKQPDYIQEFIDKMVTEIPGEKRYMQRITNDQNIIYTQDREVITQLLNRCYTGKYPREPRIRWIVYGYLYGKNRLFEDWLPAVDSKFQEYDYLVETKRIPEDKIRWNQYDTKSLNGGLAQLEDIITKYGEDKRNYKVGVIDFREFRTCIFRYNRWGKTTSYCS